MKGIKLSALLLILIVLVGCEHKPLKILIIGDSISIGYTPFVKEYLTGLAEVVHNPGNAQHTGTGLLMVDEWIGDTEWDIIQFNWGLWDLCYRHDDSKVQGKRDKVNGTITFMPDEYRANLEAIVEIIKSKSKAKLIFAGTSYVPEGEAGRYVKDAIVYNNIAYEIMRENKIFVNDIYEFSKTVHLDHSTAPDNVHFTKEGYEIISRKIIEGLSKQKRVLRKALKKI